jgi:hypothetical protein
MQARKQKGQITVEYELTEGTTPVDGLVRDLLRG